jgi:hypothetical protein
MNSAAYLFTHQGEPIRVVIAGDVLALPDERWSMGGFGSSISVEWLLHEARLPGTKARRNVLAFCLVHALRTHHEGAAATGDGVTAPMGPMVPCPTCSNGEPGFVLKGSAAEVTIHVHPRSSDWHACIGGDATLWGCGNTVEAAVEGALRSHRRDLLTAAPVPVLLTLPAHLRRA